MKIEIKDNRKELVLVTDENNFEKDIQNSKEKILDIAWTCWVEYFIDGQPEFRQSPHPDSSRVVDFNNKSIKARWNIQPEYKMTEQDFEKLISYIKEDLK